MVKALAKAIHADRWSSRATAALRTCKSESSHLFPDEAARTPTSLTYLPVFPTPTSGFKVRCARAARTRRLGLIAAGSASTLDHVIDFVSDLFDGN